jgi:hypothetical protein
MICVDLSQSLVCTAKFSLQIQKSLPFGAGIFDLLACAFCTFFVGLLLHISSAIWHGGGLHTHFSSIAQRVLDWKMGTDQNTLFLVDMAAAC